MTGIVTAMVHSTAARPTRGTPDNGSHPLGLSQPRGPSRQPFNCHSHARQLRVKRAQLTVVAAVMDRTLFVKLSMAGIKGALDLSEMDLEEIPSEVFDIEDLQDLTLAGNRIREIPADISRLSNLKRLQVAGNLLTSLPDEIAGLKKLEGLWVHGNLLESVPSAIGTLTQLRSLSLAGNRLRELPAQIGSLAALEDLGVSGNKLTSLPETIGQLTVLKKLACNGNNIQQLPESVGNMTQLRELWLQCNQLSSIEPVSDLKSLVTMSAADNPTLASLPSLEQLSSLQSLELYGCGLTDISNAVTTLPSLRNLWLEGNPLRTQAVSALLAQLPGSTVLRNLGLDTHQLTAVDEAVLSGVAKQVRPGEIASGAGYFKIAKQHDLHDGVAPAQSRSLVVAFGSAPGVPNWGGLLKKVELAGAKEPGWNSFDVLFVVDGARNWYSGGDDGVALYRKRLEQICARYETVVLLGDSMGATAALLFAPVATAVLAFCPQVDLNRSSIRPGHDPEWLDALKTNMLESVSKAAKKGVQMVAHTGSWLHDVDQARNLPEEHVLLNVHTVDSHRLAWYLDRNNQLVPIVLEALKQHRSVADTSVA